MTDMQIGAGRAFAYRFMQDRARLPRTDQKWARVLDKMIFIDYNNFTKSVKLSVLMKGIIYVEGFFDD